MRIFTIFGLIGALATAGTAQAQTWTLTPQGLGPIAIGMTVDQASHAVDTPLDLTKDDSTFDPDICALIMLPGHDDVGLLFEDKALTSIWVFAPSSLKTAKGIGPGALDTEVLAAYPGAELSGADYDDPPAQNIIAWEQKDVSGLVFRTGSDRKVLSIAAGTHSIQYMEGCL